MKQCSKCGQDKPLDDFNKRKLSKDGRCVLCRECQKTAKAIWYAANKDRANAYDRQYHQQNKAQAAEWWQSYYRLKKESILSQRRAYNRTYYQANRERIDNRMASYRKEKSEQFLQAHRIQEARWRAAHSDRVNALQWERRHRNWAHYLVSASERRIAHRNRVLAALLARDGHTCHICKRQIRQREATIDHLIPVSQGGPSVEWNLAIAHLFCNQSRGDGRIPVQLRLAFD